LRVREDKDEDARKTFLKAKGGTRGKTGEPAQWSFFGLSCLRLAVGGRGGIRTHDQGLICVAVRVVEDCVKRAVGHFANFAGLAICSAKKRAVTKKLG